MTVHPVSLTCTVDLKPGEKLTLPQSVIDQMVPGRWIVTMEPCLDPAIASRRHDAFLNGYSAEDEGLYDDLGR